MIDVSRDGLYHGDCLDIMRKMPDNSVDLVVTSPPYADARKRQYGGIPHKDYVGWFTPRALEILRILKPTGSFILNIKENTIDQERSTYVLELILRLKFEGLKWIDEFAWHKSNTMPGYQKIRLKDGWERLIHFAKTTDIKFRRDAVKRPPKPSSINRFKNKIGAFSPPVTGSGFQRSYPKMREYIKVGKVEPDNVLVSSSETQTGWHPARFPESVPTFFIKLLTDSGDIVLDPFVGSGTTIRACRKLNRVGIGIESKKEYYEQLKSELFSSFFDQ